jgi:5-formyltetrahydrofolate cyclo-ligase
MSGTESKINIRKRIWRLLKETNVARFPKPIDGRIPNFQGSKKAALKLLSTKEFLDADVVKVNPDYPQLDVRRGVLEAGKKLIMPSPRLRIGFFLLDPESISSSLYYRAATIRGSYKYATKIGLEDIPSVDMIVCGSVAVTQRGVRVGKGGGYSDLEYAILRELSLLNEETPILTSVHELQIVEEAPFNDQDFSVDIIATPRRLIRTRGIRNRPSGIIWDRLSEKQIEGITLLKKLRENVITLK